LGKCIDAVFAIAVRKGFCRCSATSLTQASRRARAGIACVNPLAGPASGRRYRGSYAAENRILSAPMTKPVLNCSNADVDYCQLCQNYCPLAMLSLRAGLAAPGPVGSATVMPDAGCHIALRTDDRQKIARGNAFLAGCCCTTTGRQRRHCHHSGNRGLGSNWGQAEPANSSSLVAWGILGFKVNQRRVFSQDDVDFVEGSPRISCGDRCISSQERL